MLGVGNADDHLCAVNIPRGRDGTVNLMVADERRAGTA
jgi:hypothetical protein